MKAVKENFLEYIFSGAIWKDQIPNGWYFVTIPKDISIQIREGHHQSEEGWGRLKVSATIRGSNWKTSIWYDRSFGSYLLPIKSVIRKKESLVDGSVVDVRLNFELDDWHLSKI